MATANKRININISEEVEDALAKRDQVLDVIAQKRDVRGATFVPHQSAWQ